MAGQRPPELTPPRVQVVLASASPGRLATLRRAGVEPLVIISGVDEDDDEPDPGQLALTLAARKADAVIARLNQTGATGEHPDQVVLGCDSVLELDGEIHGKPLDAAEATERWHRMRGRTGVLHTGHCLVHLRTGRRVTSVAATDVTFANLTDDEIAAYVATGEPMRVAGAFTLDGLGGPFVDRIAGDPHNVVGVSLPLLRRMLGDLGIAWTSLWPR
jgi:septum formation protein